MFVSVLLTGMAGLGAVAMSSSAAEYASVNSQSHIEMAGTALCGAAGVTTGVDDGRGLESDEARVGVGHVASLIRRISRAQRGSACSGSRAGVMAIVSMPGACSSYARSSQRNAASVSPRPTYASAMSNGDT